MAIESETAINEGVCAKCNKSLSEFKFRKNRRFCSALCRTRYFALKRYHDIKSTDEYKAKRRTYEKDWREANRDKWNARMRKAAARYRAKKKLNSNKVLDESSPGQQTRETLTPVTEGDVTGNVGGSDQPSQLCVCGHNRAHHSQGPESNDLSCDVYECDCTSFREQINNPVTEGPTYLGPTPGTPGPTYQNNTAFVNEELRV